MTLFFIFAFGEKIAREKKTRRRSMKISQGCFLWANVIVEEPTSEGESKLQKPSFYISNCAMFINQNFASEPQHT